MERKTSCARSVRPAFSPSAVSISLLLVFKEINAAELSADYNLHVSLFCSSEMGIHEFVNTE